MVHLLNLWTKKSTRKYNDVVLKSLSSAGIEFTIASKKHGREIVVKEEDLDKAYTIILGISLTNPQYPK